MITLKQRNYTLLFKNSEQLTLNNTYQSKSYKFSGWLWKFMNISL